jgi:putative intracellular protease/amidase
MEVKAIDLLSTFYRTDKTIEDVCAEVHLLHKKHLKRVKYTGTPENTKEIEDLANKSFFFLMQSTVNSSLVLTLSNLLLKDNIYSFISFTLSLVY